MRGKGGVTGSQSMSIQLYTGAQINFEDLTPYLTYEKFFSQILFLSTDSLGVFSMIKLFAAIF
jgi:hypothetical protein